MKIKTLSDSRALNPWISGLQQLLYEEETLTLFLPINMEESALPRMGDNASSQAAPTAGLPVKSTLMLWIKCTRLGPLSSVSKTEYSTLRMKSQHDRAARDLLGNL